MTKEPGNNYFPNFGFPVRINMERQELGGEIMITYPRDFEHSMRMFYQSLSEKDRRRYAAIEANKLGYGGGAYIARVLECDPKTIREGSRELETLPYDPTAGRVRKKGGTDGASC